MLLFHTDYPKEGGMGIAFKLGQEHIYPSSFEKMNFCNILGFLPFRRQGIQVLSNQKWK
jgi:hypothetical protein